RVPQQLADADVRRVDAAPIDLVLTYHVVAGVEEDHAHLLLVESRHIAHDKRRDVVRRADGRALGVRSLRAADAEFERGHELRRFRFAEARLRAEIGEGRACEAWKAIEVLEQARGLSERALLCAAGTQ